MSTKRPNRYLAFAIHLCISMVIFSLFVFILLQFWYPAPFFSASGGWQGLRIVAIIDIVLGPLLTLVIFSPGKPRRELVTDLSLVAIMQITALFWGIYTVYQQRPVAVAFLDYSFYTVPAQALVEQDIDLQQLKKFGSKLPVYVYIDKPGTTETLIQFKQATIDKNLPSIHNPDYYTAIDEHLDEIYSHNLDINEIISNNSDMKAEIMALMENKGDPVEALLEHHYIGLVSRYQKIVLVFNKSDKIIGYASAPYTANQ